MTSKPGFLSLFANSKPIIGMIHLKGNTDEEILERAKTEADQFISNGIDAILVEDYFNSAYFVDLFLDYLQKERPNYIYGVNILENIRKSYELAEKYGAKFIQEDSVCGHLSPGDDSILRQKIKKLRKKYPNIYLIGGVRFKYQPVRSKRSLKEDLEFGKQRCDAIAVTGTGTGIETDIKKIVEFREILGNDFPLIVAAGMTPQNLIEQMKIGDAGIVGSYIKEGHVDSGDVSPENVRVFMGKVNEVREMKKNGENSCAAKDDRHSSLLIPQPPA